MGRRWAKENTMRCVCVAERECVAGGGVEGQALTWLLTSLRRASAIRNVFFGPESCTKKGSSFNHTLTLPHPHSPHLHTPVGRSRRGEGPSALRHRVYAGTEPRLLPHQMAFCSHSMLSVSEGWLPWNVLRFSWYQHTVDNGETTAVHLCT